MSEAVSQPFQLVGGNLALDFVNTLDNRFSENGPDELLADYSDLVRFLLESQALTAQQARTLNREASGSRQASTLVGRAKDYRESLACMLYDWTADILPSAQSIQQLQSYFQAASSHRTLRHETPGSATAFSWTWDGLEKDLRLPLWILSQAAADLITSPSMDLVRTCASETCRWLFLDTSKNHTRRWCNMKLCGNRTKARRFQARARLEK